MIVSTSKFLLRVFAAVMAGSAIVFIVTGWLLWSGPISLQFLTPYVRDALNIGVQGVRIELEDTILAWADWERTIDIRVKEGENQTVFDIPYSSIRHEGILIQVYYNPGPFGKSQWFLLPYRKGIALMPNSLTLPINQWVSEGLTVGGWVRVVILKS